MVVDSGYMCKKCKKIYHKSESNLPIYCKKCGEDLVESRCLYNLVDLGGDIIETRTENMFGGYDYIRTTFTNNVEKVKIKRKFLFWWTLFNK